MLLKGGDNMGYARWATKEEMLERLKGVNLETGVKQSGLPVAYDDESLNDDSDYKSDGIFGEEDAVLGAWLAHLGK